MTKPMDDVQKLQAMVSAFDELKAELSQAIVGQETVIEQLVIALLARGHALLVGVPGLAKTLLIKSLADVLDLSFSRIQFTPDLMPSDITGTDIIEEDHTTGKREFRFVKGPVFANIVLADEINRTPPKTQAALLEAMQEHRVTAGVKSYVLEEPFFVLATQNPIEQEGTYPLPEAQLDRFMFNLKVNYPSRDEERKIVDLAIDAADRAVEPVLSKDDIREMKAVVAEIHVEDNVRDYAVRLVHATRDPARFELKELGPLVDYGAFIPVVGLPP